MFIFQNLEVYKRSRKLSVELTKIAIKFPYQYGRIRDQLVGAVISIPLNIAEGNGRQTVKDKNQFLRIARASAYELVAIIEICHDLGLLNSEMWINEIEEICKIISSLIKK